LKIWNFDLVMPEQCRDGRGLPGPCNGFQGCSLRGEIPVCLCESISLREGLAVDEAEDYPFRAVRTRNVVERSEKAHVEAKNDPFLIDSDEAISFGYLDNV
jgi:hypothetical protein